MIPALTPTVTRMPSPALRRVALLMPLLMLLAACASGGGVRGDAAAVPAEARQDAPVASAIAASSTRAVDDAGEPSTAGTQPAAAAQPTPADTAGTGSAPDDTRTQAERDYDAIYGAQPYNPVADSTLPAPAQMPVSYDPWEKWNRKVHTFNNVVDRSIAKPLAKAYVKVVPRPVRRGVSNFFNNLGQPANAVNALLQGKPTRAAQSLGRFVLNTTVGVAGLFDPASKAGIPNHSEDFGQTLGVWGWRKSRYLELPLFGPRTVRDTFGLVGDAPLAPIRYVEEDRSRVFLQGLQLVDVRTQLFAVDAMRAGAVDDYALVRNAWLQRRNYQIFGDRKDQDDTLPPYLRDDQGNPTVPADVMPIIPGSSTP